MYMGSRSSRTASWAFSVVPDGIGSVKAKFQPNHFFTSSRRNVTVIVRYLVIELLSKVHS